MGEGTESTTREMWVESCKDQKGSKREQAEKKSHSDERGKAVGSSIGERHKQRNTIDV